ncbi:MAG: hypothetical protein A2651_02295 [Candidatus Yanofskybacteria bacterium RIFCSPHIGHO2_01_FULL_42_12]|uniref:Uncharacterized protein n=1 Tax=Candidatus Yanofskybacteria bacterium RIFCSPLOWO2_01_FULL_42_49 TaxID=1802694 RepID=A0A1F8GBL9_9BACT|nr:MAG: hypothetical protein A2651_02295 [Candidatus Yanofskybacteria bacterium RIFCSPHIGHO2_01_FULL_42_12]OGN22784.1 MAG: hypothetical protein A2918_01450 [Candidatus Yanofskybacteria bacterium RIFCSPLOWO2_01_FULL_42_49]
MFHYNLGKLDFSVGCRRTGSKDRRPCFAYPDVVGTSSKNYLDPDALRTEGRRDAKQFLLF